MFGASLIFRSVSKRLRALTLCPAPRIRMTAGLIEKTSTKGRRYLSAKASPVLPKDHFRSHLKLFRNDRTLVNSHTSLSCVQHIRPYSTQFKQKDRIEEISSNTPKNDQNEENNRITNAQDVLNWLKKIPKRIMDGIYHFGYGLRLLSYNTITSIWILTQSLSGKTLIQRERRLLKLTGIDLLRLTVLNFIISVPLLGTMWILIPPFRRKVNEYFLPSTWQTDHSNEQQIALEKSVPQFLEFIRKVQNGDVVDQSELNKFVHENIFDSEFTLDALTRQQLEALCRFMNVKTFGTDDMLKVRIELQVHELKNNNVSQNDDIVLIDSLSSEMRTYNDSIGE